METTTGDQYNDQNKTKSKDSCNNTADSKSRTSSTIGIFAESSNHVALLLVKHNGKVVSTGNFFLLTESLGLTCFHVVEDVLKSSDYRIEISFNSNPIAAERCFLPAEIVSHDEKYDYAFLRVMESPIPERPGLLQNLAPPQEDEALFVIGNSKEDCKKIENCPEININNHEDPSLLPFSHMVTIYNNFKILHSTTLKTFPDEVASGAPVINSRGELVAMHTGRYTEGATLTANSLMAVEIIIMETQKIEDLSYQFLKLEESNKTLQSYMSSGIHPPDMERAITRLMNVREAGIKPLKITLELTIKNEDDWRNMEKYFITPPSQTPFAISKLLLPFLDYKENCKHPSSEEHGCSKCKSGD